MQDRRSEKIPRAKTKRLVERVDVGRMSPQLLFYLSSSSCMTRPSNPLPSLPPNPNLAPH